MSIDEIRQRASTVVKDALASGDDEWKVLEPHIKTIQAIRAALGDNRGVSNNIKLMSVVAGVDQGASVQLPGKLNDELAGFKAAQRDFRAAISNEQTSTDQLSNLLEAVRAAERTIRGELATHRTQLRELVTRRQEAQLYQMGILD